MKYGKHTIKNNFKERDFDIQEGLIILIDYYNNLKNYKNFEDRLKALKNNLYCFNEFLEYNYYMGPRSKGKTLLGVFWYYYFRDFSIMVNWTRLAKILHINRNAFVVSAKNIIGKYPEYFGGLDITTQLDAEHTKYIPIVPQPTGHIGLNHKELYFGWIDLWQNELIDFTLTSSTFHCLNSDNIARHPYRLMVKHADD